MRTLSGSPRPVQIDLGLRVRALFDLIEIHAAAVVAAINRQPVVSNKPPKGRSHNGEGNSNSDLRARSHR